MTLDIRGKLSAFLNEYSHDIVYIRRDKRFRCECYSERSRESADANCPRCFGTAFQVFIEKYRTRRTPVTIPESLIGARHNSPYGNLSVTAHTYYFEHNVQPYVGDVILEVEWSEGMPVDIREKFEISYVDKKLGEHGEIAFYQVHVRSDLMGGKDNAALRPD